MIIDLVGLASALFVVGAALATLYAWFTGLLPVLYRLGLGLSRRRVAIFAKGDALRSLRELLADSQLFKPGNLQGISTLGDFGRGEAASVYLVHYPDWADGSQIEELIRMKPDATPLILYAPQAGGRVSEDVLRALERQRNAVLCNFRGRLLNDLVVSMITTSYEKK